MQSMARQELAEFMYLDSEHKPRSKFLEYMFEDLYHGRAIGELFVENFEAYCNTFFEIDRVDLNVYTHTRSAVRFVSQFGMISISPINPELLKDKDYAHCKFQSKLTLKKEYHEAYGIPIECHSTVAPTEHSACLIAFVQFMREITIAHIEGRTRDPTTEH